MFETLARLEQDPKMEGRIGKFWFSDWFLRYLFFVKARTEKKYLSSASTWLVYSQEYQLTKIYKQTLSAHHQGSMKENWDKMNRQNVKTDVKIEQKVE